MYKIKRFSFFNFKRSDNLIELNNYSIEDWNLVKNHKNLDIPESFYKYIKFLSKDHGKYNEYISDNNGDAYYYIPLPDIDTVYHIPNSGDELPLLILGDEDEVNV